MSEEVKEEKEVKKSSGKGMKIGLIVVGLIALIQVIVLGVIFSDRIIEAFENFGPDEVELEIYTLPLEPFQVNLAPTSNSSQNNFLRTTMHLAYQGEENLAILEDQLIQIQALVTAHLRLQTINDINTVEKTQLLGEEIQEIINELLETNVVVGVYFVEFIWQ